MVDPYNAPGQTIQQPSLPQELIVFPSLCDWLAYCDNHPHCGGKGIVFSNFTSAFSTQGFYSLEQLDGDFVSVDQLRDWMGIGPGTGVTILQYAKADLKAIQEGALVVPALTPLDPSLHTYNQPSSSGWSSPDRVDGGFINSMDIDTV